MYVGHDNSTVGVFALTYAPQQLFNCQCTLLAYYHCGDNQKFNSGFTIQYSQVVKDTAYNFVAKAGMNVYGKNAFEIDVAHCLSW